MIGLALVSVCALSAIAASAASATLPEFSPASGVKLEGTSGTGLLETVAGTKVTCTANKDSGEITAAKEVTKVHVTFTGCTSGGFECKSTKATKNGELATEELKATLGYISAANKEVGIDFKPVGTKFIEFSCVGGIVEVKVTGSVICPVTPVNKLSKTFTVACKQEKGKQKPESFEKGEPDVLVTQIALGAKEQSGEETTATVTATPEGEIKA